MSKKDLQTSEESGRGHRLGPGDAPVTLIEYGDFQCPTCRAFNEVVKELISRYGAQLDYVFKHFPLLEIHPRALPAALAAEAAASQGRFWDMHEILFERQDDLSDRGLLRNARDLELDVDRFRRDIADHETRARVERDRDQGLRNGVNATPTLFVNRELYWGSLDDSSIGMAIEQAMSAVAHSTR